MNSETLIVGLDIGFGHVKVIASNGKWALFPSVVEKGKELVLHSGFGSVDPIDHLQVELDGEVYFAGNLALRETEAEIDMNPNKIFELDFEVLFYTALALVSGGQNCTARVYLGLPVNFYRTQLTRFQRNLQKHLEQTRFVKLPGQSVKMIRLESFEVFPQAGGALFNQILDFSGNVRNLQLARGKVGVIDAGTKTTDCIYMEDLKFVDNRSFSINDGGTHKILMEIRQSLMERFNNYAPRLVEVDRMLRERKVEVGGKTYSLGPIIDEAANRLSKRILREMSAQWPNWMEFKAMILAGGGGLVLHKTMKEHVPDMLLADDEAGLANVLKGWSGTQFANALGFLKLAMMKFGGK